MRPVLLLILATLVAFASIAGENTAVTRVGGGSTDAPRPLPRIEVIVEIPVGTHEKWEMQKSTGEIVWQHASGGSDGRVIDYLAYPANYGFIPNTELLISDGGDGDPVDVILLGPKIQRGERVMAQPIGILKMEDNGQRDDKVLAITGSQQFSGVDSLEELESSYPGVSQIISTWFANYKGGSVVVFQGWCEWDMTLGSAIGDHSPSSTHHPTTAIAVYAALHTCVVSH